MEEPPKRPRHMCICFLDFFLSPADGVKLKVSLATLTTSVPCAIFISVVELLVSINYLSDGKQVFFSTTAISDVFGLAATVGTAVSRSL